MSERSIDVGPDPLAVTHTDQREDTVVISGEVAAPPRPSVVPSLEGTTVLHFDIVARLGHGGMGIVYKAFDTRLRRFVAVKVLARARAAASEQSLFREARRAAALAHPGIATVYEIHDAHEPPFFVMELVEGESLRARLRSGALPAQEAVAIAVDLARALGHAHAAGIVHRDVKPENVMLARGGGVKLLDFGVAKQLEVPALAAADDAHEAHSVARTAAGAIVGTPEYMSPEQALGSAVDARSDVFTLGIVMYEMLSGERPFRRSSAVASAIAVVRDDPLPLDACAPDVAPALVALVARCMEKSAEARFANASEVEAALRACDDPTPTRGGPHQRARGVAIAIAAAVVALAALVAVAAKKSGADRHAPERPVLSTAAPPPPAWVLQTTAMRPPGASFAISQDATFVAVPTRTGTLSLQRISGEGLGALPLPRRDFTIHDMVFVEGDRAILAEELVHGRSELWRIPRDGTPSAMLARLHTEVLGIAVDPSPRGRIALVDAESLSVGSASLEGLRRVATFSRGDAPNGIAWSPDGAKIATISANANTVKIDVIDVASGIRTSVPTRDLPNKNFTGPGLAWASNDAILYLRRDPSDEDSTELVESRDDTGGSRRVARLPGTGYAMVSRVGDRLLLRRTIGTYGVAHVVLGRQRADVRVDAPDDRSAMGWFGDGGFAYSTRRGDEWSVVFDRNDWREAAEWTARPFNAPPFLLADGIAAWQNPFNAPECACIARRRGRRDEAAWASDGEVACGSAIRCPFGHPESCVVWQRQLGSSSVDAFDTRTGKRGRSLFSAYSEIASIDVSADGSRLAIMLNDHLKMVDVRSTVVSDVALASLLPQFASPLPGGEILVTGWGNGTFKLVKVTKNAEEKLLWESETTWLGPSFVDPAGRSASMEAIEMTHELLVFGRAPAATSPP